MIVNGPAGMVYRPLPAGPLPVGLRLVRVNNSEPVPCTVGNWAPQDEWNVPVNYGRATAAYVRRSDLLRDDALFD